MMGEPRNVLNFDDRFEVRQWHIASHHQVWGVYDKVAKKWVVRDRVKNSLAEMQVILFYMRVGWNKKRQRKAR